MDSDTLQLRIDRLTELDRLELVKALGADAVRFEDQRPPDGHLGELDTVTAIVTITLATVNVAGAALALWLSRGGKKAALRDHLIIETPQGRLVRKLEVTGSSHEELKPELVRQLLAELPRAPSFPPTSSSSDPEA